MATLFAGQAFMLGDPDDTEVPGSVIGSGIALKRRDVHRAARRVALGAVFESAGSAPSHPAPTRMR